MRFTLLLLVAVFISLTFISSHPEAGQAFSHCEDAENTADSMACVKQRHEEAQSRLKKAFENILQTQDKEGMQALHIAQNEWISYRDKECRWKVEQVENESMRRIEELSCLTTLTQQRAAVLEENHIQQQEKDIVEYSDFPRWMNVVAKENPQVFWRYGDFLSLDIDCDGQQEAVMAGQEISTQEVYLEGSMPYKLKTFLAVSENPATGRPQTRLIEIALGGSTDGEHPCDPNVELSEIPYPLHLKQPAAGEEAADEKAEEQEEGQCMQALKITGRWCEPSMLFWDGSDFKFHAVEE